MKNKRLEANDLAERRAKIVFQLAKELKKVHILKFFCNKKTYWQFTNAAIRPQYFTKPTEKNYIRNMASNFYMGDVRTKLNKEKVTQMFVVWEDYYKQTNGYLAIDSKN